MIAKSFGDMRHWLEARLPYFIVGCIIVFLAVIVALIVKRVLVETGAHTRLDVRLATAVGRLLTVVIVILGLLIAAVVIFPSFHPGDLVAGLGITSVAIGFAFKDLLQNSMAGILLLWRQPFRVGDQIRSGQFEGTVEDINTRSTRLKTFDGEQAVLPNSEVYANAVLVYTAYGIRRVRFTVGVGYADSIEEARKTIYKLLEETEGVMPDPGPWVYVSELAPSSVNFTVYFWTDAEQSNVLPVSDRVATGIKLALDHVGVDMPYPHTVVLLEDAETHATASAGVRQKSGPNGNR